MKKAVYDKSGRQIVSSAWKEFNQQTNCISTGNVYANTQYSSFIRPWKEKECNGRVNPEGHLLKFDMNPFEKFVIPEYIRDILTDKQREESVILYMFFTTDKNKHVKPFAWVVTSKDYKLIRLHVSYNRGESQRKRISALREATSYITV